MFDSNRHPDRGRALDAQDRQNFGADAVQVVRRFLAACPKYAPTPLYTLPDLARHLGIATLAVKDEGQRLGLGSFKALGGAYAVNRLLLERAEKRLGRPLGPEDLTEPAVREIAKDFTVACATDGNHGRSVAAGARLVGSRAVIFVHEGVEQERVEAIARFGAQMVRVAGTYDDAVAEAGRVAAAEGWAVVSDTSWPGYERVPALVMQGYTVLADEMLGQMPQPPTHVFLQAGVGGFAAAISAHLALRLGAAKPAIVVVEPDRAACLFESNRAGQAIRIASGEPTVMAMLECYEPSLLAWRILSRVADAYVTVTEDEGLAASRRLARPQADDPAIVAGESGAAGAAGLVAVAANPSWRDAIGLDGRSRVAIVNTEGATAPALYARIING